MVIERRKVFFCFVGGRSTETLVILDAPARRAVVRFLPRFVLGHSVEHLRLLTLGRLDDWRDELE